MGDIANCKLHCGPPKIQTIHQRILKLILLLSQRYGDRPPQNTNDPSEDTETFRPRGVVVIHSAPKIQTIHQRILKLAHVHRNQAGLGPPQNTNDPSEDTET